MFVLISVHSFMYSSLAPIYGVGYDSSFSVGSATSILNYGWPIPVDIYPPTVQIVAKWPAFSILAGMIHIIGSIGWADILRFLPSLIYCLVGISLYLFASKSLSMSPGSSATLGVVAPLSLGFMMLNGFVNGGLGTPLLCLTIYLVGQTSKTVDSKSPFIICLIIATITIVIGHHLTAFYLLLIFILFFLHSHLKDIGYRTNERASEEAVRTQFNLSVSSRILLLYFIAVSIYWASVGTDVLPLILQGFIGVTTVQINTAPSTFLSNPVSGFNNLVDYSIFIVFGIIVIQNHKNNKRRTDNEGWPLFLFASIIMIVVFLGGRIRGAVGEFARGSALAFVFLFAAFLSSRDELRLKSAKLSILLLALILIYSCNQVVRYDQTLGILQPWADPDYSNVPPRGGFIKSEDLNAVLWFPENESVIGDQIIYSVAAWRSLLVEINTEVFQGNLSAAGDAHWIFLRDTNIQFVFCPYQSSDSFGVNSFAIATLEKEIRVFDNGGVTIYSLGSSS